MKIRMVPEEPHARFDLREEEPGELELVVVADGVESTVARFCLDDAPASGHNARVRRIAGAIYTVLNALPAEGRPGFARDSLAALTE